MEKRINSEQYNAPEPDVSLRAGDALSAERKFDKGYGSINLINGLQPMEEVIITDNDGVDQVVVVGAEITVKGKKSDDLPERYLITVDHPVDKAETSRIGLVTVGEQSEQDKVGLRKFEALDVKKGKVEHQEIRFGTKNGRIIVSRGHSQERPEVQLEVSGGRQSGGVDIKVAEASHPIDRRKLDRPEVKKERRHNRMRRVAKIMGVFFAARALLLPGGLVDDLADPLHDGSSIIDDRKLDDVDPDSTVDGLRVGDHPDLLESQQEYIDQHNQAVERLGDVFDALDNHDYESIHQMANEYEEQNSEQIFPQGRLETIKSDLESASTPEEVMDILNEFADFYDKNVDFYDPEGNTYKNFDRLKPESVEIEFLKNTANNIISAYQNLPRDLIRSARFNSILLAGGGSAMESLGGTQAFYQSYDSSLVLRVDSAGTNRGSSLHDLSMPDRIENSDAERLILHETGHASDDDLMHDHHAGEGRFNINPSFALTSLIGHQNRASLYGAGEGRAENVADNFANTLSTDLINHPDFVRLFTSEASQDEVELMLDLEKEFPGMTAHLYEAKLPQDNHDSDQTRDIMAVALLAAFNLKKKRLR
jgi:hypothetical protein